MKVNMHSDTAVQRLRREMLFDTASLSHIGNFVYIRKICTSNDSAKNYFEETFAIKDIIENRKFNELEGKSSVVSYHYFSSSFSISYICVWLYLWLV